MEMMMLGKVEEMIVIKKEIGKKMMKKGKWGEMLFIEGMKMIWIMVMGGIEI